MEEVRDEDIFEETSEALIFLTYTRTLGHRIKSPALYQLS